MNYAVIDRLIADLKKHRIQITSLTIDKDLRDINFCRLQFTCGEISFKVSVDDEYGDGLPGNHPAMLLHLLLRGCDDFEDANDYATWCRYNCLEEASILAQGIFAELEMAVPVIMELLGPDVQPVSSWDYELNTGVTQALRSLSQDRADS